MKKIYAYFIAAAAFIALTPGLYAQVVTNKWVNKTPNADGTYTLTLESYVTGDVQETVTEKATDFVLALDYSGSMNSNYDAGKDPVFNDAVTKKTETSGIRTKETKTKWTYSNLKYGNSTGTANLQWYYLHTDGVYYPVRRSATNGSGGNERNLWIVIGSTKWYLKADGTINKTRPTGITSNSTAQFNGTLYKGWNYATYKDADESTTYVGDDGKNHYYGQGITGNAAGTAGSQYYYYDKDKIVYSTAYYYPVHKVNNLPDSNGGNNARALYVERSGVKWYLTPAGLKSDYDHSITTDYRSFWFGPLYRGWTYSTITAAKNDGTTTGDAGGHWVKYSTDALGNAAYYPLQKETRSATDSKYQVFFIDRNGTKRYLRAISTTPSTSYCAYSGATTTTLFFGNLYTVKEWNDYNRFTGLERAVAAFAEGVYNKANEKGLSHRIACIAWGSPRWITTLEDDRDGYHHPASTTSNTSWTSSSKKIPANARNIERPFIRALSAKGKPSRGARILIDFKNMLNDATNTSHPEYATRGTESLAAIKAEFSEYPTNYHEATCIEFGMGIAQALFDREWRGRNQLDAHPEVKKDFDKSGTWETWEDSSISSNYYQKSQYKRPKILIIVSDGGFNGYNWETFATAGASTDIGKASINNAKNIATQIKADGVKIYCIHVAPSAPNTYEKAIATSADYCIRADSYGKELLDAMVSIVNKADVADVNLTSTAVVQDIVTPEFSVPSNATIKTYTANCTGKNDENEYVFGSKSSFTSTITKTVNPDGTTKVTVTGFDYATNYVGPRSNGTISGKKLIIEIPIAKDPDIVGGEFPTNTSESVIFDKPGGQKVADFPIPSLPFDKMNLRIVKKGLREKDSAVFAIYRKPREGSSTWETTPYMTVLLSGNASGSDVEATIIDLNANYHYKIVETTWSWLYTSDPATISTEDQNKNPYIFTNTLREDGVPKNGEDVVHNIFPL